ncbi:hypothetical protein RM555_01710 [Micromonospora sp. DSM 115977]|uniref:Uncharacterized protein n=1 Tax=Micromonospora reichwaldensis TaxID=3075516 RepID=A0ABU2WP62_9ACTN|nr:hypothetical protein [Micromonospora sp. DSM 115977]MDT0527700.1 hypothetical protein [Micromonospora sp. DSM 115977]
MLGERPTPTLTPRSKAPPPVRMLRAGEILHLTRAASPQFVTPMRVRVIRELVDRFPPYGWLWFEGYQLDAKGRAVAKRELFVLREGLEWVVTAPPPARPAPARRPPARPRTAVG